MKRRKKIMSKTEEKTSLGIIIFLVGVIIVFILMNILLHYFSEESQDQSDFDFYKIGLCYSSSEKLDENPFENIKNIKAIICVKDKKDGYISYQGYYLYDDAKYIIAKNAFTMTSAKAKYLKRYWKYDIIHEKTLKEVEGENER